MAINHNSLPTCLHSIVYSTPMHLKLTSLLDTGVTVSEIVSSPLTTTVVAELPCHKSAGLRDTPAVVNHPGTGIKINPQWLVRVAGYTGRFCRSAWWKWRRRRRDYNWGRMVSVEGSSEFWGIRTRIFLRVLKDDMKNWEGTNTTDIGDKENRMAEK